MDREGVPPNSSVIIGKPCFGVARGFPEGSPHPIHSFTLAHTVRQRAGEVGGVDPGRRDGKHPEAERYWSKAARQQCGHGPEQPDSNAARQQRSQTVTQPDGLFGFYSREGVLQ